MKEYHTVLNIGKGKPDHLMDLVKLIEKIMEKNLKLIVNNIPHDIKRTFSNTKKAKKLINWHPKTNLHEGIKKFIEWYKTEYDV